MAVASASIHVLGYVSYILFVRRGLIDANPLSWLMFAYGTGLLTFLEWRSNAQWQELLLPVACSVSSVIVAALSVRLPKMRKVQLPDIAAFTVDAALTAIYVGIWFAHSRGIGQEFEQIALIALLVCANLTTLASFVPILRSTLKSPSDERVLPWLLWTSAYGLLLLTTLRDVTTLDRAVLLIYPAMNALLHFLVAAFAMSRWWRFPRSGDLAVSHTENTGLGLFGQRRYRRGERVFVLAGKIHNWRSRSETDATLNENWFGIGRDKWVEPEPPFMYVNHSCEPNLGISGQRDFVALRDIAVGEELTFDYAISEDEPHWQMSCKCGAPSCRVRIGPVQSLPYETFLKYQPFVGDYFRRVYLRHRASNGKSASARKQRAPITGQAADESEIGA